DSSSSQNPTHQYASYGLYNLCLTITTSSGGSTCTSMYCDSIGLDSNGMLLKRDGFGITVLNESDVLGINEHLVFQDVNVYPNPSTGLYTVELDMHSSKKITVRSMNSIGQEVMSADYNLMAGDNTLSLDLSEHTDGLYFINIKADNVSKNVRVYLIR
ncbi:T9SS type A sorting domain-containing protein, partial [Bacteroidia bacterium]|nr:T9SS type A sorting domain-containing protein [Bacteroidia bacterium]